MSTTEPRDGSSDPLSNCAVLAEPKPDGLETLDDASENGCDKQVVTTHGEEMDVQVFSPSEYVASDPVAFFVMSNHHLEERLVVEPRAIISSSDDNDKAQESLLSSMNETTKKWLSQ